MSWQKCIIFLLAANLQIAQAQIFDDFNQSSAALDEQWRGDRHKYIINSDNQLQLNDSGAGQAIIYTEVIWQENMSWEAYIRLGFNPSDNNRLDLYLWSDSEDLEKGSGYLLRIGQGGSNDAITLISQQQGDRTTIATGSLGSVATAPVEARIQGFIEDGLLTIEMDDMGGTCFITEIEAPVIPLDIDEQFFFGWLSKYTSTRKDKFFFDDIYLGAKKIDTTPPRITTVTTSPLEIFVNFSEGMDASSVDNADIVLEPDVIDKQLVLMKEGLSITTMAGFDNLSTYQLTLTGLADISGNLLDTVVIFRVAAIPSEGSLVINEVLFNPKSAGKDYVELFNNTEGAISLSQLTLSNSMNGDEVSLSELPDLAPQAFIVVTDGRENILDTYPSHNAESIYAIDIPRFNNDVGNVTVSFDGQVIDELDYDEDYHQALIDDVDGISLERIDPGAPSNDPDNWTSASSDSGYGTPGLINSVRSSTPSLSNEVSASHKVFSPNGDGQADVLHMKYTLTGPGYLGTARVYDENGHLVRTLINNQIVSQSGSLEWKGRDDSGRLLPIGIYLIHISLFNLEGQTVQKKISVGLGDFIN